MSYDNGVGCKILARVQTAKIFDVRRLAHWLGVTLSPRDAVLRRRLTERLLALEDERDATAGISAHAAAHTAQPANRYDMAP